jgi:hypothetical protein
MAPNAPSQRTGCRRRQIAVPDLLATIFGWIAKTIQSFGLSGRGGRGLAGADLWLNHAGDRDPHRSDYIKETHRKILSPWEARISIQFKDIAGTLGETVMPSIGWVTAARIA